MPAVLLVAGATGWIMDSKYAKRTAVVEQNAF